MSIEDARHLAYQSRQDYQGMQRQVRAAQLSRSAARYERLPTLTASGNYGVTGVTHGLYHGTFVAAGELQLPLFKEAQFRGDADVAQSQQNDALNRLGDLKQQIDQQLRDSMLDLNSSQALVRVSQQNVDLATRALSDANDRFAAGVDDNLPVVQAQATLSQAQSQLISDTLSYNQAKLGLARNLGIVDTQYKTYLHGGKP
jgi:outer membrane protein TolC